MTLIDTHCHLNFENYHDDFAQVIQRAEEAGVTRIINPGVDLESSREALALAAHHDGIYAAVGIHPNSTADFSAGWLDEISVMAHERKVVAIGEIGLDYHWNKSPKAKQFDSFEAQLALAARLELPVIIHNREASEDVIAILETWATDLPPSLKDRPGVLHSFSAPAQVAERAINIGFYLGISGPITYKNADDLRKIAMSIPSDRIVIETDGPFLTPTPHRGKRNEPAYILLMADRLAALRRVDLDEIARITTENAVRLFGLPAG
jgi:TatD DNase family protein